MYIGLIFWTSPKSHRVEDAGSSPVRAEIFTGYSAAKVHIGYIFYKLSFGPVAEGFRRRTLASNLEPPHDRSARIRKGKMAPSEQPHILG